jgi:hypothetical protein
MILFIRVYDLAPTFLGRALNQSARRPFVGCVLRKAPENTEIGSFSLYSPFALPSVQEVFPVLRVDTIRARKRM